jgi:hypothetical protein
LDKCLLRNLWTGAPELDDRIILPATSVANVRFDNRLQIAGAKMVVPL